MFFEKAAAGLGRVGWRAVPARVVQHHVPFGKRSRPHAACHQGDEERESFHPFNQNLELLKEKRHYLTIPPRFVNCISALPAAGAPAV